MNNYLQDLYASIAMDVKNEQLFTRLICRHCNECKNQQLLQDLYSGIAMDVKPTTITKPICGYCIFEMTLWK